MNISFTLIKHRFNCKDHPWNNQNSIFMWFKMENIRIPVEEAVAELKALDKVEAVRVADFS